MGSLCYNFRSFGIRKKLILNIFKGSKIIGKSSLRFLPLVGWCWLFTESIFIHRKWDTDKKLLVESLDKILVDYPKGHYFNVINFLILIYFYFEKISYKIYYINAIKNY